MFVVFSINLKWSYGLWMVFESFYTVDSDGFSNNSTSIIMVISILLISPGLFAFWTQSIEWFSACSNSNHFMTWYSTVELENQSHSQNLSHILSALYRKWNKCVDNKGELIHVCLLAYLLCGCMNMNTWTIMIIFLAFPCSIVYRYNILWHHRYCLWCHETRALPIKIQSEISLSIGCIWSFNLNCKCKIVANNEWCF